MGVLCEAESVKVVLLLDSHLFIQDTPFGKTGSYIKFLEYTSARFS